MDQRIGELMRRFNVGSYRQLSQKLIEAGVNYKSAGGISVAISRANGEFDRLPKALQIAIEDILSVSESSSAAIFHLSSGTTAESGWGGLSAHAQRASAMYFRVIQDEASAANFCSKLIVARIVQEIGNKADLNLNQSDLADLCSLQIFVEARNSELFWYLQSALTEAFNESDLFERIDSEKFVEAFLNRSLLGRIAKDNEILYPQWVIFEISRLKSYGYCFAHEDHDYEVVPIPRALMLTWSARVRHELAEFWLPLANLQDEEQAAG